MRVTYKLEKEDYFNIDMNQMRNIPRIKKSINVQRFVIPIIFTVIILILIGFTKNDVRSILPLYGILVIGWIILYPKILIRSTHKRLSKTLDKQTSDYFDFSTIEVREDGIYKIEKDEEGKEKALFVTEGISGINEDKNYMYIFLPVGSFYVIPLKYFEDENYKKEFLEEVKKLKV